MHSHQSLNSFVKTARLVLTPPPRRNVAPRQTHFYRAISSRDFLGAGVVG